MSEKDLIKEAVAEVLDDKLGSLYVDRETHHDHHKFLADMIEWMDETKGVVRRTFVRVIVYGVLSLMLLGFILWGRTHI